MRRLLAAALLTGALVAVGGCSADKTDKADQPADTATFGPAPSDASSGTTGLGGPSGPAGDPGRQAAGDAALAGNTAAICKQAAKTGGQFASMFAQDRKLLAAAASTHDKDQAAKATEKASRDVDNYSFALLDMAKLAANPPLKKALGEMGNEVSAVKGDVTKLDDKKVAALQATLDKAC
jgi:hypothetical protein